MRTRPPPSGNGAAVQREAPSRAISTPAATMSTIESTAPTSWNVTGIFRDAVYGGLRLGEELEDAQRMFDRGGVDRRVGDQRADVRPGAMRAVVLVVMMVVVRAMMMVRLMPRPMIM